MAYPLATSFATGGRPLPPRCRPAETPAPLRSPVYDTLLDDYEKGLSAARLDTAFAQLKAGLVPLLAEVRARGTPPDAAWLAGDFDPEAQATLCNELAVALGFDLGAGRLDVSVHPFTGGSHPTDVRMTTRFKRGDVTEGITGAIHETGHALYEQGRNADHDGLPVSAAHSMGIHESQSLLWERMVGLSAPFAAYLLPKLAAAFPALPAGDKTGADLYAAINKVKTPSLIRVESDELTYGLHVILRYELERALVEGGAAVADLPRLWNQVRCVGWLAVWRGCGGRAARGWCVCALGRSAPLPRWCRAGAAAPAALG